jgi:two-component system phosphate regulon sensor histidine kinase PhoR
MKKNTLYFLIGLICLSSLGIVTVQFFWIRNAVRVKETQFNRSVNDALGMAVNRLETKENVSFLSTSYKEDTIRQLLQAFVYDTLTDWQKKIERLSKGEMPPPEAVDRSDREQNAVRRGSSPLRRAVERKVVKPGDEEGMLSYEESLSDFMERMNDLNRFREDTFFYEVPFQDENLQYQVIIREFTGNMPLTVIVPPGIRSGLPSPPAPPPPPQELNFRDQLKKLSQKTKKVQDVIRRIAIEMESRPKPIEKRIERDDLQSVLKESLADKDIRIPFEFAVLSPGNDSIPIPIKTKGFKPAYLGTEHRVSLFPYDIIQKPDLLLLYFPGERSSMLRSISWLLAGSTVFILFILLTSGLSIYFLIRQKKISDIKTDFINNMTHEFKTPIATISIAADSISNPKVLAEPEMIRNYSRIIKEENSRMNSRVEQVLQMALLDSRDFRLEKRPLDVHELLQKIATNIRLQIAQREGILDIGLAASRSVIEGDETHLVNVFLALFDNAIKYSKGKPEIRISSRNEGDSIILSFEDRGIGMSPETRKKIFDKFYRMTSGNIHNVKGFGLGLSYARAIVLAHEGEISVASEPGNGSRFEVTLPLAGPELQNNSQP